MILDLVVTEIGYKKILGRDRTGPNLNVTQFAVAQHPTDYTPVGTETSLQGTVLYKGDIETSATNTRGDRIYLCTIPNTSTPGIIYEIGLYLDTGELFALAVLNPRYTKTTVFQLRVYCRLTTPKTNLSVEFNAVDNPVINVLNDYADLPQANIIGPNAYVILNGHCGVDKFDRFTPTFVCKWKNGDEWGLANGSLVYYGTLDEVDINGSWVSVSRKRSSQILIDVEKSDVAMITISDGIARYQTRHVQYNRDSSRFDIVDRPFDVLPVSGHSIATIWAGPGCCGGNCY